MATLGWDVRAYILAVAAAAVTLWVGTLAHGFDGAIAALGVDALLFFLITVSGEFMGVPMPRGGWLSISTIPHIALALLFPTPVAILIATLAITVHQVYTREPWYKAAFNAAIYALAVGGASTVVSLAGLAPRTVLYGSQLSHAAVLVAVAAVYYALDNILTYVVVSLSARRPLVSVIAGNLWYNGLPELSLLAAGELLALLWVSWPGWSLAILLPALVTHRTLGYMRRLQTETEKAVMALADMVDDRDSYTYHHSRRVARYAERIALELGLGPDETDTLVSAARVHDLGKIGIPDAILLKPGRLTPEEMATMCSHPGAGAAILGQFHLFREGTKLALHHHEWFDGRGYPDGLAGEEIPLGARIMAVADAYDAMTSDRPYRKALPQNEALRRLWDGRGSQFDPAVVAALVRVAARGELTAEEPYEPGVAGAQPDEPTTASDAGDASTALTVPTNARAGQD